MGTAVPLPAGATMSRLSGHLRGTIASTVQQDTRLVSGGAARLLLVLGLLACIVLAVVSLAQVLITASWFLLVLALAIAWAWKSSLGFSFMRSLGGGLAQTATRTHLPQGPGTQSLDVTCFRMVDGAGQAHDCEMIGELRAPPPRLNDDVEVSGRRRRDGVIAVRSITNTVTGTVLRAHVPLAIRAVWHAPWVVAGLVVVAAIVVLGGA